MREALEALLANHKHHQDYDDYGGYKGSDLEQQNLEAIAMLQSALPPPQPAAPVVSPELNPEDIVVDVVYKQLGGFAPIVSHGIRVAHKPSRISVVVDSERSQHKNRQLALQALRSIISEEFKS